MELVSLESYGILEFSEKVYFLVTILWSALGRTFHSLVSLAKFGQIQLQDTNSILVTLDWYFQHRKKFSWTKVVTFVVFEIWTI